jgi:hypothetical protein
MKDEEYCIPDKSTYEKIQQLKPFVALASGLPETSENEKRAAKEIIAVIENIDKRKVVKDWSVTITLFHKDYPDVSEYYLRSWSVYFEFGRFEIEAETRHRDYHQGHHGNDFSFYGYIYLCKDPEVLKFWPLPELDEFIKDALNYQAYVNEQFNVIEVCIEVDN